MGREAGVTKEGVGSIGVGREARGTDGGVGSVGVSREARVIEGGVSSVRVSGEAGVTKEGVGRIGECRQLGQPLYQGSKGQKRNNQLKGNETLCHSVSLSYYTYNFHLQILLCSHGEVTLQTENLENQRQRLGWLVNICSYPPVNNLLLNLA